MQRDAVRAFVHGLDDLARGRELAAQDERRRHPGLFEGERSKPNLVRMALAEDPGPPFAVDAIRGELVGAIVAHQQQRPVGDVASQLADHLQAHLVGPVEVLELQHRRAVDAVQDPVRGRPDDQAPRAQRIAVMAAVDRQQILGERAPLLVAAQPDGQLADGGEGDLVVLRGHRPTIDAEPRRLRLATRGPHQAGLAQTGAAREEDRVPPTGVRLCDELIEMLEKVIAADKDGALNLTGAAHGASLRLAVHRPASVERPMARSFRDPAHRCAIR